MKKNKNGLGGIMYSTNPDYSLPSKEIEETEIPTSIQDLRVELNRLKAGKVATLIRGFRGTPISLENLGKKIKTYCGTGGAVKDGIIIIQGDFREKVLNLLILEGYKAKKSGG